MNIVFSQLSAQRVDLIRNAESIEQATEMGFIDGLIDKIFRGGAKREAIVELYSIINQHNGDTWTRMRALLDLRSLILPEHRSELRLALTENPNGSCDYTLFLEDRILDQREGVTDESEIAALRHAENAIKVDDYLLRQQNFAPNAASLVQRSDRFLIQQGEVGDCYVLASMIGIMTNPDMQETIEKMAEITADGKLRLKFDANMSAPLTDFLDTVADEECEMETLNAVIGNPAELASLRSKGYDLSQEDGLLRLDISEDRLKHISDELNSATTNSLIVNILEHFVGNLLLYTVESPVTSFEGEEALKELLGEEKVNALKNQMTEERLNPLRSDRDSLLAHQHRAGGYHELVPNLLGYQTRSTHNADNVTDLSAALTNIHENGRHLAAGGKNGFVFFSLTYGEEDQFGMSHCWHTYTLQDVVFHDIGEVAGVFLVNPWGNKREPEYYTLKEIIDRDGVVKEFIPPNGTQSLELDAAPPHDPSDRASPGNTYVLFQQYA